MSNQQFTFEQVIEASPEQVFYAFTNATALREWLSDLATVDPRPGGRLYLFWNSGFYSSGEFTEVEKLSKVSFTWNGRSEPAPSIVTVSLEPGESHTLVKLVHTGVGAGDEWENTIQEIKRGWKSGLENLASVLATGEDLRYTRRPMLGITVNDFNPEIAQKLGVPIGEGMRLETVLDGYGACEAGLQPDDVIVSMGGQPIVDFISLPSVVSRYQAGEIVEIIFYRGAEKKMTNMKLSPRPIPQIPPSPRELAEVVRQRYDQIDAELEKLFTGVDELAADYKPAPGEWSAKEVMAHLILGERYNGYWIEEIIGGQERWADSWPGNLDAHNAALIKAHPNIAGLIDALKCAEIETISMLESLPNELVVRKGSYRRLATNFVQDVDHFYSHLDQMRAAIAAGQSQ